MTPLGPLWSATSWPSLVRSGHFQAIVVLRLTVTLSGAKVVVAQLDRLGRPFFFVAEPAWPGAAANAAAAGDQHERDGARPPHGV